MLRPDLRTHKPSITSRKPGIANWATGGPMALPPVHW
jgi:hypothetical protein